MNRTELRATLAIGSLFVFRMLGLFMILPTFALQASQYDDMTPRLIGMALGIYGLSQAFLQIPLGSLSDRIGRKQVILLGLAIFGLGSFIAGSATSIYSVILGRCLQGAGAIGSTTLALLADVTDPKNRTKAMAIVGALIGASFMLAIILGPVLSHFVGVKGIFWLTGLLALLGMLLLTLIPTVRSTTPSTSRSALKDFRPSLQNPALLRLYLSIFCSHAILTASFAVLPLIITHQLQLPSSQQWLFYLPVMLGAALLIYPFIKRDEAKSRGDTVFLSAITLMLVTQGSLFFWHQQLWQVALTLLLFLAAFSLLEATIPSLVSKIAPANHRGAALGVYSTAQFLGIFVGGLLAGSTQSRFGLEAVFAMNALMTTAWLLIYTRISLKPPTEALTNS